MQDEAGEHGVDSIDAARGSQCLHYCCPAIVPRVQAQPHLGTASFSIVDTGIIVLARAPRRIEWGGDTEGEPVDAVPPVVVQLDDSPGVLDLDVPTVVCQTFDLNAETYQRTATAHTTFSGRTGGALTLSADLVYSTNSGASWTLISPGGLRNRVGDSASNVWVNTSQTLSRTLLPGSSTRFGVRISRIDGAADLDDSRCFLNAQVGNRNEPLF
jgi:hypothetical protein